MQCFFGYENAKILGFLEPRVCKQEPLFLWGVEIGVCTLYLLQTPRWDYIKYVVVISCKSPYEWLGGMTSALDFNNDGRNK